MVELPNDEDFAPRLSFSVKRSLLAYVEPDDYVLTVHGSICTDDDTEIGRLLRIYHSAKSCHKRSAFSAPFRPRFRSKAATVPEHSGHPLWGA